MRLRRASHCANPTMAPEAIQPHGPSSRAADPMPALHPAIFQAIHWKTNLFSTVRVCTASGPPVLRERFRICYEMLIRDGKANVTMLHTVEWQQLSGCGQTRRAALCGRCTPAWTKSNSVEYARRYPGNSNTTIPRVEDCDVKTGKVLNVPRHERKAVFKGRCGDYSVHNRNRDPPLSRPSGEVAAALGNRFGNRENPSGEPITHIGFQPAFEPLLAYWKDVDALADFTTTRASGVSRVSSDGMLVSTRYPLTTRCPGRYPCRAQNPD
jgi:hypothetical protein